MVLARQTRTMPKRNKRKYTRRTTDEQIADLEARIAELRAVAKEREKFSPQAVSRERERLELTAKQYAELVGVAMITVYSWESGRSRPRAGQLEQWLEVRGIAKEAAWKKLGLEEARSFSGRDVRAERKRLGLSAAKYARLAGVSILTVYNWERDHAVPSEKGLAKWLAVRGIGKAKALKKLGIA